MNNFLKIALILIISGGVISVGTLCFLGFDFSKFDKSVYENKTYTYEEDIKNINVDAITSDVALYPATDNVLKVTCHETKENPYEVTLKGDTLTITKKSVAKNLNLFAKKDYEVSLYLPKKYYDNIDLKCTTGDIKLEIIDTNNLSAHTTTGNIELSTVNIENTFSANVTTGDIKLDRVLCRGDINCKATTGDINFDLCGASKSVTAKATTGDISGSFITGMNFSANATTGKVNVPASVTTGAKCNLRTTTGDINNTIAEY